MTNQVIPAEAVEAATKAFRETHDMGDALMNALEAVAPYMMAAGFDAYGSTPFEIRLTGDGKNWEPFKVNPFRPNS